MGCRCSKPQTGVRGEATRASDVIVEVQDLQDCLAPLPAIADPMQITYASVPTPTNDSGATNDTGSEGGGDEGDEDVDDDEGVDGDEDDVRQHNCCQICNTTFTVTRRRHHCRRCGRTVCHTCSSSKALLPAFGHKSRPVRHCDDCIKLPSQSASSPLALGAAAVSVPADADYLRSLCLTATVEPMRVATGLISPLAPNDHVYPRQEEQVGGGGTEHVGGDNDQNVDEEKNEQENKVPHKASDNADDDKQNADAEDEEQRNDTPRDIGAYDKKQGVGEGEDGQENNAPHDTNDSAGDNKHNAGAGDDVQDNDASRSIGADDRKQDVDEGGGEQKNDAPRDVGTNAGMARHARRRAKAALRRVHAAAARAVKRANANATKYRVALHFAVDGGQVDADVAQLLSKFCLQVSRRYSDFMWLHKVLLGKRHARQRLPHFPSRALMMTAIRKNTTADFVARRAEKLGHYLRGLLLHPHPDIRSDPDLRFFCTVPDAEFIRARARGSSKRGVTKVPVRRGWADATLQKEFASAVEYATFCVARSMLLYHIQELQRRLRAQQHRAALHNQRVEARARLTEDQNLRVRQNLCRKHLSLLKERQKRQARRVTHESARLHQQQATDLIVLIDREADVKERKRDDAARAEQRDNFEAECAAVDRAREELDAQREAWEASKFDAAFEAKEFIAIQHSWLFERMRAVHSGHTDTPKSSHAVAVLFGYVEKLSQAERTGLRQEQARFEPEKRIQAGINKEIQVELTELSAELQRWEEDDDAWRKEYELVEKEVGLREQKLAIVEADVVSLETMCSMQKVDQASRASAQEIRWASWQSRTVSDLQSKQAERMSRYKIVLSELQPRVELEQLRCKRQQEAPVLLFNREAEDAQRSAAELVWTELTQGYEAARHAVKSNQAKIISIARAALLEESSALAAERNAITDRLSGSKDVQHRRTCHDCWSSREQVDMKDAQTLRLFDRRVAIDEELRACLERLLSEEGRMQREREFIDRLDPKALSKELKSAIDFGPEKKARVEIEKYLSSESSALRLEKHERDRKICEITGRLHFASRYLPVAHKQLEGLGPHYVEINAKLDEKLSWAEHLKFARDTWAVLQAKAPGAVARIAGGTAHMPTYCSFDAGQLLSEAGKNKYEMGMYDEDEDDLAKARLDAVNHLIDEAAVLEQARKVDMVTVQMQELIHALVQMHGTIMMTYDSIAHVVEKSEVPGPGTSDADIEFDRFAMHAREHLLPVADAIKPCREPLLVEERAAATKIGRILNGIEEFWALLYTTIGNAHDVGRHAAELHLRLLAVRELKRTIVKAFTGPDGQQQTDKQLAAINNVSTATARDKRKALLRATIKVQEHQYRRYLQECIETHDGKAREAEDKEFKKRLRQITLLRCGTFTQKRFGVKTTIISYATVDRKHQKDSKRHRKLRDKMRKAKGEVDNSEAGKSLLKVGVVAAAIALTGGGVIAGHFATKYALSHAAGAILGHGALGQVGTIVASTTSHGYAGFKQVSQTEMYNDFKKKTKEKGKELVWDIVQDLAAPDSDVDATFKSIGLSEAAIQFQRKLLDHDPWDGFDQPEVAALVQRYMQKSMNGIRQLVFFSKDLSQHCPPPAPRAAWLDSALSSNSTLNPKKILDVDKYAEPGDAGYVNFNWIARQCLDRHGVGKLETRESAFQSALSDIIGGKADRHWMTVHVAMKDLLTAKARSVFMLPLSCNEEGEHTDGKTYHCTTLSLTQDDWDDLPKKSDYWSDGLPYSTDDGPPKRREIRGGPYFSLFSKKVAYDEKVRRREAEAKRKAAAEEAKAKKVAAEAKTKKAAAAAAVDKAAAAAEAKRAAATAKAEETAARAKAEVVEKTGTSAAAAKGVQSAAGAVGQAAAELQQALAAGDITMREYHEAAAGLMGECEAIRDEGNMSSEAFNEITAALRVDLDDTGGEEECVDAPPDNCEGDAYETDYATPDDDDFDEDSDDGSDSDDD